MWRDGAWTCRDCETRLSLHRLQQKRCAPCYAAFMRRRRAVLARGWKACAGCGGPISPGAKRYRCKPCDAIYQRHYRKASTEAQRERAKARNRERYATRKADLLTAATASMIIDR